MSRLDRRQTLKSIGLGAGLVLAGPAAAGPVRRLLESLDSLNLGRDLAGLRRHPHSARFFADAYLAQYPAEAAVDRLVDRLMGGLTGGGPLPDQLRQRIARDWDQGRTVKLAGCFMTRTEARLCALAALAD